MKAGEAATKAALWVAERFNPITNSPSAPLKTQSMFASFAPSLVPRAAMHQGVAGGLSVLAADVVASAVDATNAFASHLAERLTQGIVNTLLEASATDPVLMRFVDAKVIEIDAMDDAVEGGPLDRALVALIAGAEK